MPSGFASTRTTAARMPAASAAMSTAISRRSRSFLGSSFLKDLAQPDRYLVVEYWSEMVVYERHHADFADEVAELEQQRSALVRLMRPLGLFNALDVPARSGPTWSQRTGRE